MEVTAKHRFARISPQKCRLVADQIRGLPVEDALNALTFELVLDDGLVFTPGQHVVLEYDGLPITARKIAGVMRDYITGTDVASLVDDGALEFKLLGVAHEWDHDFRKHFGSLLLHIDSGFEDGWMRYQCLFDFEG